jgi:hypothetical protein
LPVARSASNGDIEIALRSIEAKYLAALAARGRVSQ